MSLRSATDTVTEKLDYGRIANMGQRNFALVTGANGHLGNNLVRLLIKKAVLVRATVRNLGNISSLSGLDVKYMGRILLTSNRC